MENLKTVNAAQFFSRHRNRRSCLPLDNNLLPGLTTGDIVEISGGPGAGKTEFLYHLVLKCILPSSEWNGFDLKGLDQKVIIIDNDLHFDLFRLTRVLEKRLQALYKMKKIVYCQKQNCQFINERLELLEIVKCKTLDEFLCTLRYLEVLPCSKCVLMIDGLTSYHWSLEMRKHNLSSKAEDSYVIAASLIKSLSEKCLIPIIVTKRQLVLSPVYNQLKLPRSWRNIVTKQVQLTFQVTKEHITYISVQNVTDNVQSVCSVSNSGMRFSNWNL